MSTGSTKRSRPHRGSSLKLAPGWFERNWSVVRRGDVLLRVGMCLLAAVLIWAVTGAWDLPFQYREGDVPSRDIIARVDFEMINQTATELARRDAVSKMLCIYEHDRQLLDEVRQGLKNKIFALVQAKTYQDVDKELWQEFTKPDPAKNEITKTVGSTTNAILSAVPTGGNWIGLPPLDELESAVQFDRFKNTFKDDPELDNFMSKIGGAMQEFDERGLLENLEHEVDEGNQTQITVYPVGDENFQRSVEVDRVRIVSALKQLKENLAKEFESTELSDMVYRWLSTRMPRTLTLNRTLTAELAKAEADKTPPKMRVLERGKTTLATAGLQVDDSLAQLRAEHDAYKESLGPIRMLGFSFAKLGMYLALYVLCGFYSLFRQRKLLNDTAAIGKLLATIVATVCLSSFAAPSRFELVPLMLFAMIAVIVHGQELALLLSASVAMVTTLSLGYGVAHLVTATASMATAILLLRHIRTRTKLIYVGLWTAATTFLTAVGVAL
ncbi:MAG: hypothetical protein KDB27_12450, partial [Planctomycetales bacterium]|nr:hypothetical protein [Planctomycetales bacterium]